MRWRFRDDFNPDEVSARALTMQRIVAWWDQFSLRSEDLRAHFRKGLPFDIPGWMKEHLQSIHPHIFWEFGPAVHCDGHRLVITPESAHHLRPLTDTILANAPQIKDWEFYAHRIPESVELTKLTVRGRTGKDIAGFKAAVRKGEHQRIDICYCSPNIGGEDDREALNAAFVATETLLGGEQLDKWIGTIAVQPLQRRNVIDRLFRQGHDSPKHTISLERLRQTVQSLINSTVEQLPPRPCSEWVDQAEWTVLKLQPDNCDDYVRQLDLCVARSPLPSMWRAAHSGDLFYSDRFSRCGETFCFIKLDGLDVSSEKSADKSDIEDALDAAMKASGLGCQIGGGTGRRYSYIDLALVDVTRSIDVVQHVLRSGNVPKRSWLLFYDSVLTAEWVGIYDDSPPPPMPDLDIDSQFGT